ncbi:helix-turn-helix domain-containing protein [Agarivorans aestuarii]|uniref:helix-turn-helix domain-containing protein n=1 Tax=Agarivorans aestuarii TaxID=1563703 RepID=UPI001C80D468|nr:helix-turn-helix domain-containing protein [Agarivorans aestuarii]
MSSNENKNIPLVRRENVEFFASMLKEIDHKSYDLLRAALIPNDIYNNADYEYLPETCLKNVLDILAQSLANDRLGWLFLRSCKETFVPRMLANISQIGTVKDALERFCEALKHQSTDTNLYLEESGNTRWLVREKKGVNESWFKYAEMFSVICMAELIRALSNDQWRPMKIGIQSNCLDDFAKLPSLEHAQFFLGRPVTALEIPEQQLFSPAVFNTHFLSNTTNTITNATDVLSFREQFPLAVKPYLSMGKLPIKLAADILRLNVRTLQRRLKAENIVYKQFIEALVFEQVEIHLQHNKESITQLANRFGYSDTAHFSRSFKRIYK